MCGGNLWNIGTINIAMEEASRTRELTENLTNALLETRKTSSSQNRAREICAKLNGLDHILLTRALVKTARYESVQVQAARIVEILKKGGSPIPAIKIIDPTRP